MLNIYIYIKKIFSFRSAFLSLRRLKTKQLTSQIHAKYHLHLRLQMLQKAYAIRWEHDSIFIFTVFIVSTQKYLFTLIPLLFSFRTEGLLQQSSLDVFISFKCHSAIQKKRKRKDLEIWFIFIHCLEWNTSGSTSSLTAASSFWVAD